MLVAFRCRQSAARLAGFAKHSAGDDPPLHQGAGWAAPHICFTPVPHTPLSRRRWWRRRLRFCTASYTRATSSPAGVSTLARGTGLPGSCDATGRPVSARVAGARGSPALVAVHPNPNALPRLPLSTTRPVRHVRQVQELRLWALPPRVLQRTGLPARGAVGCVRLPFVAFDAAHLCELQTEPCG